MIQCAQGLSLATAVLAAAVLPAAALLGQSYGDQPQTLTIGAAAFQVADPTSGDDGYIDTDGYLYAAGTTVHWVAPLALPDGAVIQQLCLYIEDQNSGFSESAHVVEEELASGGVAPFSHNVAGVSSGTGLSGYGYYCSPATYFHIRNNADANGDSFVNPVAYRVEVAANVNLGFGGVRITWKRDVSPPPVTPTFADVPAIAPAWQHIEALAASSITSGCGNGNYCPDATLTRRQMAVFLAKALGLHWVD